MIDSESIDQFMTKFMRIVNQLRINGEKIEDQIVVEKVLRSLPKVNQMVVTTILEWKYLTILSVEELIGSLMSHEARLNLDDPPLEHALKSNAFINRDRGKGFRGRRGRGRGRANHQT